MNKCLPLALFAIIFLSSCIEQIDSFVGDFQSSLVVDGLISNENTPYAVYLSRTTKNTNETPELELNAKVAVEDDLGNQSNFTETEPGKYTSNPGLFTGMTNRSYRLKITTNNGIQYLSEWCELLPSGEIDSVYWEPESYMSANLRREVNGVTIYIDGKLNNDDKQYCRWTYEEDWKFHTWYQEDFEIHENDSFAFISHNNYICWKSRKSNNINIYSTQDLIQNKIQKQKIRTIHSDDTDRLMMRYSILVKQLSISQQEYEFWKNLSQSEQESLDLFGKQPYSIAGNIYNTSNPEEKVLGYFQVTGVSKERIYIDRSETDNKDIISYTLPQCLRDTTVIGQDGYSTLYDIYDQFYLKWEYGLAELLFPWVGPPYGIVFTTKPCSDCTFNGKNYPPDFWEEL